MPQSPRWILPLAAMALLGTAGVAGPTGFIDAAMEWDFREELREGVRKDVGSCSTRLELLADGKIRATHRYERTVSTETVQLNTQGRFVSTAHVVAVHRTFQTDSMSRDPLPAEPVVVEYPAVVRLVRHPDGSATPVLRPQLKAIRVAQHKVESLVDRAGKQLEETKSRARIVQITCDAIDKFQSALRARNRTRGAFPALQGTASVAGRFSRAIPAKITGSWDLTP